MAVQVVANEAVNLETSNIESGRRGDRHVHVEEAPLRSHRCRSRDGASTTVPERSISPSPLSAEIEVFSAGRWLSGSFNPPDVVAIPGVI
ncbi:MAG: hypothetical protein R2688_02485 [Fimbriimonadaceae bacterium]